MPKFMYDVVFGDMDEYNVRLKAHLINPKIPLTRPPGSTKTIDVTATGRVYEREMTLMERADRNGTTEFAEALSEFLKLAATSLWNHFRNKRKARRLDKKQP